MEHQEAVLDCLEHCDLTIRTKVSLVIMYLPYLRDLLSTLDIKRVRGKTSQIPHCTGKIAKKINGKENLEIWPKHREVLNFLVLKIKDIAIFAAIFPNFFFRTVCVCHVSFAYETFSNHRNLHRENLRSGRENAGNLKIHFKWGP